jgi:hypothetical protein
MSDPDDDTLAGLRGEEATVVSRRRRPGGEKAASDAAEASRTEASRTEDQTVIRPRASTRAPVVDEPAVVRSASRRVASSGQPEDTVYRPRPADPVIVPRAQD